MNPTVDNTSQLSLVGFSGPRTPKQVNNTNILFFPTPTGSNPPSPKRPKVSADAVARITYAPGAEPIFDRALLRGKRRLVKESRGEWAEERRREARENVTRDFEEVDSDQMVVDWISGCEKAECRGFTRGIKKSQTYMAGKGHGKPSVCS
jgi:hypothetical protein